MKSHFEKAVSRWLPSLPTRPRVLNIILLPILRCMLNSSLNELTFSYLSLLFIVLLCLLRNLYAGQEATVRTGHGIKDWFQIGKGVRQGCILSPCLFNLYAEYMQNARLNEAQAGIKIVGRNISNLRYANDTMAERKRN